MTRGRKPPPAESTRGRPLAELSRAGRRQARTGTVVVGGRVEKMPAPSWLSASARWWHEWAVAQLVHAGMLDGADLPAIVSFAITMGELQDATVAVNEHGIESSTSQGTSASVASSRQERLLREARQLIDVLPFSASARARAGIAKPKATIDSIAASVGSPRALRVVGGGDG